MLCDEIYLRQETIDSPTASDWLTERYRVSPNRGLRCLRLRELPQHQRHKDHPPPSQTLCRHLQGPIHHHVHSLPHYRFNNNPHLPPQPRRRRPQLDTSIPPTKPFTQKTLTQHDPYMPPTRPSLQPPPPASYPNLQILHHLLNARRHGASLNPPQPFLTNPLPTCSS